MEPIGPFGADVSDDAAGAGGGIDGQLGARAEDAHFVMRREIPSVFPAVSAVAGARAPPALFFRRPQRRASAAASNYGRCGFRHYRARGPQPGHLPSHLSGRKRLDTGNGDRRLMDMRSRVELKRSRRTGRIGTKPDCPGTDPIGELAGTPAATVIKMFPRA